MKKIGIFSGTFDPVHLGHIEFAKAASKKLGLDKVYFLPEMMPRAKIEVTDYAHRVGMLRLAAGDKDFLEILELPEENFSVGETLDNLKKKFPNTQLVFLFGSDVFKRMHDWPHIDRLLKQADIAVGLRSADKRSELEKHIVNKSGNFIFVETGKSHISASKIRKSDAKDMTPAVREYIKSNKLYQ